MVGAGPGPRPMWILRPRELERGGLNDSSLIDTLALRMICTHGMT